MKHRVVFGLTILSLAAIPVGASVLDQYSVPAAYNAFIVEDTQFLAQTFTVGVGGLLDQVQMELARHQIAAPDPIVFELRSVLLDGSPGNSILATTFIPATALSTEFELTSVNLRPFNLSVKPGDKFALVLRTDASPVASGGGIDPYAWKLATYDGGNAYIHRPGMDPEWGIVADLGFRTYVDAPPLAAVPESGLLGWCAVGALLLLIRRRRHATRRPKGSGR